MSGDDLGIIEEFGARILTIVLDCSILGPVEVSVLNIAVIKVEVSVLIIADTAQRT